MQFTELQKNKLMHMFELLDVDGNGVLEYDDFRMVVDVMAEERGLDKSSRRYLGLVASNKRLITNNGSAIAAPSMYIHPRVCGLARHGARENDCHTSSTTIVRMPPNASSTGGGNARELKTSSMRRCAVT